MLTKILAWAALNPELSFSLFALAVAVVRGLYALVSRAVAPYPRLRAAVEAVAALGPDVLRFALQAARAVTGRPMPSPELDARDGELARLRDQLAVVQGERIELRARLAELVTAASAAVPPPPPGTRPTSLPPPPGIGMMVMFVLGLLGCPKVIREPDPTPPRDGCTQGATLCHQGHPWVCGPDGRWSRADRRCDRLGAVCCTAPSPYDSGLRHACVPAAACVEVEDGGVR